MRKWCIFTLKLASQAASSLNRVCCTMKQAVRSVISEIFSRQFPFLEAKANLAGNTQVGPAGGLRWRLAQPIRLVSTEIRPTAPSSVTFIKFLP